MRIYENGATSAPKIGGFVPAIPQTRELVRRLIAAQNGEDLDLEAVKADPQKLRSHIYSRQFLRVQHIEAAMQAEIARVEWILDGFLARGVVTTLFGHGGVGKSFLALDAAINVACGNDWLGFKCTAGGECTVVYVDFEMHPLAQCERVWRVAGGTIPEHFVLCNPSNFDGEEQLFEELLLEKPDLIVVDSFGAYAGARNTADQHVIVPMLRQLQQFAEAANCAVLTIDHVTKSDANSDRETTPYGSVYKHNLVRLAWNVREVDDNLLELTRTKNNLQDTSSSEKSFQVRRCSTPDSIWHERCAIAEGGRRGAIVEYLRSVGDVGATAKEIAEYLEAEGYGVAMRTVQNELAALKSVITKEGGSKATRYKLRLSATNGSDSSVPF